MVLDVSCLSRLLRLVEVSSKINTGQSEFACHVCARVKCNLSNCKDIFLHTMHTTAIFIHNKFDLLVFIYITIFLVYRLFATCIWAIMWKFMMVRQKVAGGRRESRPLSRMVHPLSCIVLPSSIISMKCLVGQTINGIPGGELGELPPCGNNYSHSTFQSTTRCSELDQKNFWVLATFGQKIGFHFVA